MGAWGEKGYDSDSGLDWIGGLVDVLRFTLDHAFWSRWSEEGVAAAQLLTELPPVLQDRLGQYCFNEALVVVDSQLRPEELKPWKDPSRRKLYLVQLRRKLSLKQKVLAREEKRTQQRMKGLKIKKGRAPG